MESLSDTLWDVVIVGTGLQQSLLALALSRSDKKVLHVDPNQYYGGPEAAFSLQEVDDWVERHRESPDAPSGASSSGIFTSAVVTKPPPQDHGPALSFPRAYSLALAPQVIHARSRLISQLVSSRAFRQLEFLAVGSFFVLTRQSSSSSSPSSSPSLTRIPSTREDVFSDSSIPARAKRSLMKFLKFVLDYDSPPQADLWQQEGQAPLAGFLERQFKLDADLRAYVLALTLAPDYVTVITKDGLAAIHRHLTSMSVFGPGFAALYPKWGGAGEIAQVACRAGAVGGGVYMLGSGVKGLGQGDAAEEEGKDGVVEVQLSEGTTVKTKLVVRGCEDLELGQGEEKAASSGNYSSCQRLSRLVAVVGSPLSTLFEHVVEGSPIPAVAVVACPPGSVQEEQQHPVYALAHSSETGECPSGQSVLYLSTLSTPSSKEILDQSLGHILAAIGDSGGGSKEKTSPPCLYQLYYEQATGPSSHIQGFDRERRVFTFPLPSTALAFEDNILDQVREAWAAVVGDDGGEYMKFADREGMGDDDDDPDI